MNDTRCLTYTGKVIDIFDLKIEDICLEDIAHSLSVKTRFNGASKIPYSIAQHCCLAAAYAKPPVEKTIALLHDAEEAYLPDIPGPWKSRSPFKEMDEFGEEIRRKIWTKYMPWWCVGNVDDPAFAYHYVDRQLLIAEIRLLVHNWQSLPVGNALLEHPIIITPWSAQEAENTFLLCANMLGVKD